MGRRDEIELVFHDALTSLSARPFCRAVLEGLDTAPGRLWLNLEDVKAADVVGLGVLLQAVARAERGGIAV